ncbi:carph-isopro domain-containing protein [Rhodobacter aestuarii]|uniref:carph-isopro domain-containing protein n=1 Tax=Rhodobacter aestuarii TaxID=453582 RepID=UPI0035946741
MARDLGQKYTTVVSWRDRGSIPAKYDAAIIKAANKRGKRVTPDDLFRARVEITPKREAVDSVAGCAGVGCGLFHGENHAAAQPTGEGKTVFGLGKI